MLNAQVQIDKLKAQWKLKKKQVDDLTIRAGIPGRMQEMTLQVGQSVKPGDVLAKVAQPWKLMARLQIAETQAKDILLGQKAEIDTRNGIVPGHVIRIDASIVNGTRTVDCKLDGPLPPGAVPDLSVDGTIEIQRLADVVYVGRPVFGQPNSQVSLFKLDEDGKGASRVTVKLGRSSVNTIEVVDGLKVGDQVILSDMSAQDQNPANPIELRGDEEWPNRLIHLEGVTKVFVTDEVETHALAGIHLDIKKGEYLSIAGPSGCGKSTLLAILGLLDSPSDGTYILNGKPVQDLKLSERARIRNREIGFIFQAFNLIGDLTVYENVELPLTYRGMPSAERKKRVHEALERVGMSHRVKHYPSQLSGGQQQRVAVARALAGDPSILLADEPTGNLDSANGEAVMDLLRELHRGGATICMVTHDPRYARYADRNIHLFDGRIVEESGEAA